jgi:hypothetical protein
VGIVDIIVRGALALLLFIIICTILVLIGWGLVFVFNLGH